MHAPEGVRLRVQTRVSEPGQHRRELLRLTGLEAQENQARRMLNDLRSFRAWLEQDERPTGARVGRRRTAGWPRSTCPSSRPCRAHLAGRVAPAQMFHEVLEHRWFLSEQAGRDVGTTAALASYLDSELPRTPVELTTPAVLAAGDDRGSGGAP